LAVLLSKHWSLAASSTDCVLEEYDKLNSQITVDAANVARQLMSMW